ncbi:HNH endonuclease [Spirulina subsalsa FACHB-351]|uniref:HNH endonuclease n=1 Tax=Spirulina subsalsa FACHB-351 TaxID=234711 RepID=A0ABT3LAQ5_9CYAN|nr:HNH endonuclease [Spirulina subsalsa]MCW6038567.1 HNH endonuclease [Spirulina subsalsa FACHB-351]
MSVTELLTESVVVFSKNYLPLSRINLRRAILLLVTQKAEPLDFYSQEGWEIRSCSVVLWIPIHIRLTVASTERVWKTPSVTRREVLRRDHHRCQYCGSHKKLTLDHVIPRSKGGKHSWDNVVIACERCNGFKGDRTPQQAGMELRTQPKPPANPTLLFANQFWGDYISD